MSSQDLDSGLPSGNDGDIQTEVKPSSSRLELPSILSVVHVLWLKKWLILGIWFVLALPVGVLLSIFDLPRSYTASTVLRFPAVVGAQTNVMRDVAITQGESIISIFNSFRVLDATIRSLSLRFRIQTAEVFYKDVFVSLKYSDHIGPGVYSLIFSSPSRAKLLYKPKNSREALPLFDGTLNGTKLETPDLKMEFQESFLRKAPGMKLSFSCQTMEEALQDMKKALSIRPLGTSNFQVTYKDADPFLVANILNDLRDQFLEVYYGTTEVQDVSVLAQMEKDLDIAKERLEKSQDELSSYYASHPELVVESRPNQVGDNLAYLESRQDLERLQTEKTRIESAFRAKPPETRPQERYFWATELLSAMAQAGEPKANILRNRLFELENQHASLAGQLGQGHPKLKSIEEQKEVVFTEMEKANVELVASLEKRIGDQRIKMVRSAPSSAPTVAVKVRLELDRLNSVNQNNEQIYSRLLEAYNRAKLTTGSEFFKVTVVDNARPALYTPPSLKTRLLIAGVAVGFLFLLIPLGFGGYFLVFQRVYTKDDVKRLLKVKVLGSVSLGETAKPKKDDERDGQSEMPAKGPNPRVDPLLLFYGSSYRLADLEAYRLIREETESFFRNPKNPERLVLLVTSTQPSEGKTMTASNLAITFARKGKRTLLVDADFRLGRIAEVFDAIPSTGLDEMLGQSDLSLEEFVAAATMCFVPSVQSGLVLVPRKVNNPNAGEMVGSVRFKAFIAAAREQFDVVIIDSPPMLITPEPLALSGQVDGVLYVTRSGVTPVSHAREALTVLSDRRVRTAAVLNAVKHSPFEANRYQKYAYYYRDGASSSEKIPGTSIEEQSRKRKKPT